MVNDSYRDTGVTWGRAKRDVKGVRYERVETPLSADLDQSAAAITSHLRSDKHKKSESTPSERFKRDS